MTQADYIAQPSSRTTLNAIERIMQGAGVETMDVAAAYITSSGLNDLLRITSEAVGGAWPGIEKRWLTSFDYCRTEPIALDALLSVPSSAVRVHDADFCLSHGGMPRVPFHPKAFLFRTTQRDYALAGSGNVSRSGLSRGHEAGLVVSTSRTGANEPTLVVAVNTLRAWFSAMWNGATPLGKPLLKRYSNLFESTDNLKAPVLTEDDLATSDVQGAALSSKNLQKLRVCRNLWIEAGNITKNRGPNLPGNQLMMKRLSRVFFGFSPGAVPENTQIGSVEMRFGGGPTDHFSLTYSDNKMDKLTLPIPGAAGPASYDNECLLFKRTTSKVLSLTLGTPADRVAWRKKSKGIEGAFKMASGREWGVF